MIHIILFITNNFAFTRNHGSVSLLLGNGDGTFQDAQDFAAGISAKSIIINDLDGNGYNDLAITSQHTGDVKILYVY